jgi:serine/threonine protein kinase
MAVNRCPNCFEATNATPCPHCGWQPGHDNPPPALTLGQLLDGRYRIGRVLGHGGFGITYLAWDDNLHLRLAIKEYLPRDCASRAPDGVSLAVYSGPAGEQFAYGLERFLEEARALAHFDQHPGIVTVKNFFRAHGTGYCVMDYVEGITLRQYLDQQPGGRIGIEAALKLLMPVADALRAVHKEGLLHRDIAPDNIYLTQDGRIKLLDFGAARFAAGEHSRSLSIILKPGYSPEEQYRTKGKQGPWTDVYGLAATLYRAITGQVPPESLDRLDNDDLVPPSKLDIAIQSEQEAILLKALAIKAGERFQSMVELQQAWRANGATAPQLAVKPSSPAEPEAAPTLEPKKWSKKGLFLAIGAGLLLSATIILFPWPGTNEPQPSLARTPPREPTVALATSVAPPVAPSPTPIAVPATPIPQDKPGQLISTEKTVATDASGCNKTDLNVGYTICSNKTLKALDNELESAYQEVKLLSTTSESVMLEQEHKLWIDQREFSCGAKTSPQIMECIQEKTTAQLRLMMGQPESGPGTGGRIIPVFLLQEGNTKEYYELDIQNLRYVAPKNPGEFAVNSITQSLLDEVPRRKDEDLDNRIYEQKDSLRITYASPRMISLHYSSYGYTGGAHGFLITNSFIIDATNGKTIKFNDIFSSSVIKRLTRQCQKELIIEKRRRFEDEKYDPSGDLKDDVIAKYISGLNNWIFSEDGASVIFGEYAIGSYAEGSYECHFDLTELHSIALPNAPLPSLKSNEIGVSDPSIKIPIYYAGDKPPVENISQESPFCYKFMVPNLDEQLKKIKKKYPGLYGYKIFSNHDKSKTLIAKRLDDNGNEISYYYHTDASACNDYQQSRFGFTHITDGNISTSNLIFPKSFTLADGEEAFQQGDYDRAYSILRPLAEAGVALAQDRLGYMYENGASVPKNLEIANLWIKKAINQYRNQAEIGDGKAQYQLSLIYQNGRGVAKNEAEAIRLLQEAAENSDIDAQSALARAYEYGSGVAKDKAKANLWNRKAADRYLKAAQGGDPKAQFKVGNMYDIGFVFPKNQKEAINWYRKAANQGQKEAIWELKKLGVSR